MIIRRLFGLAKDPTEQVNLEDTEAAVWEMIKRDWQCDQGHTVEARPLDLAARTPDPWTEDDKYEPNHALRLDSNFLSEDFCILAGPRQTNYLIRAVMKFPVTTADHVWGFGCWSTLSKENFEKYVDGFDAGVYEEGEPWFGWLCNTLKPIYAGPDPLPLAVYPRQDRQRPELIIRDYDHPLAIFQEEGLPPSVLLEILRTYELGPKTS